MSDIMLVKKYQIGLIYLKFGNMISINSDVEVIFIKNEQDFKNFFKKI